MEFVTDRKMLLVVKRFTLTKYRICRPRTISQEGM